MARYRNDGPPTERGFLRKLYRATPRVMGNGQEVEKLRHRRWPRTRPQHVVKEAA